ncbi:MAG: aminopeptidase P family protein [Firmicutes bacterium]|nr:aminopeptidase P family protein [Bacillota bacterium]
MKKLKALRQQLKTQNLEAALITNPVNVAYLSGFVGTAGFLVITEKAAALFTDFRYLEQAQQQAPAFEIIDVAGKQWEKVNEFLTGHRVQTIAVEKDHLTVHTYDEITRICSGIELQKPASPVEVLRRIKSREEIESIKKAQALTDAAFTYILDLVRPGVSERELALELEFYLRRQGASGLSFTMIVASGPRSALPHGTASEKVLTVGDAVVFDFGCVVDGYCSDMTRTVFVGSVTDKQRQVYEAVLAAQEKALSVLRAGLTGRQADAAARDVLTELGFAGYFGHGLGHGVGREIHEAPRLSPLSEDILESGMVVTVEPGVYLPGEFGVRIEDMVVIGEDGIENLTKSTKELYCL